MIVLGPTSPASSSFSHSAVHSHTRSIFRKLGVSTRTDALKRAREIGLWWRAAPSVRPSVVVTHRELTVLTLLAGERSEADIGRELLVSGSTVHSHVRSIYRKLGATSRPEAVELARAAGFLQTGSEPPNQRRARDRGGASRSPLGEIGR